MKLERIHTLFSSYMQIISNLDDFLFSVMLLVNSIDSNYTSFILIFLFPENVLCCNMRFGSASRSLSFETLVRSYN